MCSVDGSGVCVCVFVCVFTAIIDCNYQPTSLTVVTCCLTRGPKAVSIYCHFLPPTYLLRFRVCVGGWVGRLENRSADDMTLYYRWKELPPPSPASSHGGGGAGTTAVFPFSAAGRN